MTTRRPVVLLVLFVVAAATGVTVSAAIASGPNIIGGRWSLLWRLGLWAFAWVVAVAAALRLPRRLALGLVLATALALRVAALAGPPATSDDLYRYSWDGRVQAAGIDPYTQPPVSPQLIGLREPWLWPDAVGCAAINHGPGCTRINRPPARTIYPPLAEAWFASVYRAGGIGAHHKAWQVAGLVADAVTIGLLLVALGRWGRDRRWVALYAMCPAPVLEFVNNGHVDGLAVAFVVAAFAVAHPPRKATSRALPDRWRDAAVGALFGAGALVKLYPAVLLIVVLCLPRTRPWRSLGRAVTAAAAVGVVGYAPHVVAVGTRVLGYLPGYLQEEHYNSGGRFLLAGALGVPAPVAALITAAVFAGALAWVASRRPDPLRAATVVLAALFLCTTPVQPWYAVSLLVVCTLAAWPWPAVVVAGGYPYFFAVILGSHHVVAVGRVGYGLALGGLLLHGRVRLGREQGLPSTVAPVPALRT